jgi:hypothetical protein
VSLAVRLSVTVSPALARAVSMGLFVAMLTLVNVVRLDVLLAPLNRRCTALTAAFPDAAGLACSQPLLLGSARKAETFVPTCGASTSSWNPSSSWQILMAHSRQTIRAAARGLGAEGAASAAGPSRRHRRTSRHAVVTRRNPTIRPAPPGRHPAAAVRGGCGALWLHGGLALHQNSPAADRTAAVITCSSILVHRPCTAGRSPRTTHRSDAAQHSTAHVAHHVLYRCTGRYNWW